MFIRASREFLDDMGKVKTGQILDVTDFHGMELIRRGLATDVQGEAAATGAKGPILSRPIVSPIGGGKTASSSPADPAPQTSTSPPLAGEQGSSASTKDGDSRRSQTLSMPATGRGGRHGKGFQNSRN